ncbi:hypothetical protein [Komagataeibacter diospyri]|uniref:hypothetical protein n=1 Tax=Komagataeibacter diospyri TaxID=1932662 RepID=UPI003756EFB7
MSHKFTHDPRHPTRPVSRGPHGWHVLPMHTRSCAACFRGAVDHATCNLDTIVHWAARWPGCGWWVG